MSPRPVFRIASAGLDPRDVRLIEIVFQHSQYNKYDFQMLDDLDLTRTDILIANPTDPSGLDAISAVGDFVRAIPTVAAVPRGAQVSARHSITIDRLTLQLLPILNRVVEHEMLEAVVAGPRPDAAAGPVTNELTDIHPDDAREGEQPSQSDGTLDAARLATAAIAVAARGPSLSVPGTPAPGTPVPGTATADHGEPATGLGVLAAAEAIDGASPAALPAPAPSADSVAAAVAVPGVAAPRPASAPESARAPDRLLAPLPPLAAALRVSAPRVRLKALVADPSSAAQQQLARALGQIGLDVQCVVSGAAAVQCLARQHHDLIVTESALTDCEAFALIRHLRQSPAYRFTPVLLLRSRLQVLDKARARLDGDVTVLTKPLSRGALERIVLDTLRRTVVLDDLDEVLQPADALG